VRFQLIDSFNQPTMNKPRNNSDYIVETLRAAGVDTVFMLSGGGIMHLQNAVKNACLPYVCNFHEQACVVAAEAYARLRGFGACIVTFGPGALNAVSGIASAWYESLPLLVIAGQVRSDIIADYTKVRQLGPQEANVIDIVRPITKYARSLRLSDDVEKVVKEAIQIAHSGRPGPVLLEVPLDVQAAPFVCSPDLDTSGERQASVIKPIRAQPLLDQATEIAKAVVEAKRPLLILGSGVRIAGAQEAVRLLGKCLNVPIISAHTAKDTIDNFDQNYYGIFGTCGNRHANIILQSADLIICLGVGLSISKTGFNFKNFAPLARKIVIDIDAGQVYDLAIRPDLGVVADLAALVPLMTTAVRGIPAMRDLHADWRTLCFNWKLRYATHDLAPPYKDSVNPYRLMDCLSNLTEVSDTITTGNGLDSVAYCQAFKVKSGQKTILNGNWGSMGWDLPLSVGAHFATKGRVICITGDGSLLLNIQELMNIGARRMPVKVFVLNNGGYGSIRATQDSVFNSNYIGVDEYSGVFNPNFRALAIAFGLVYHRIDNDLTLEEEVKWILTDDSPQLIEVHVARSTWISPKASSYKDENGIMHSRDLDDMAPFLDRDEIARNREDALRIK
jgi:acetolactate synthase-1/2/3 large subunit